MARFHITASGKAAPCTASLRDCPRGGYSDHFDSLKQAVLEIERRAAEARRPQKPRETPTETPADSNAFKGFDADQRPKGEFLTPKEFEQAFNANRDKTLTVEEKRRAWPGYIAGLDRNTLGQGIEWFSEPGGGMDGLSDEQFAQLVEAMGKPMRLTPTEKKRAIANFEAHGLTGADVEAWANANSPLNIKWRGQEVPIHVTRKIAYAGEIWSPRNKDMGYTPAVAQEIAEWKAAGKPKASASAERGPRHPYGVRPPAKEEASTERQASSPKELDPAMIEALKAKYLKKFKMPFDESGLSIPELLQMAQKGELG